MSVQCSFVLNNPPASVSCTLAGGSSSLSASTVSRHFEPPPFMYGRKFKFKAACHVLVAR